jgi:uncharacterized protein (TIGR02679 family)
MATAPDAARLRALFERPGLHWILDRLVERMSRGRPLVGTIVHSKSTPEERRALDDLLGRPSTRGHRLTLDLSELAQTLRSAGIAGQLEDAVIVIRGPVENQREQTDRRRDEWATLFATTRARLSEHPALVEWVNALARDGTLKRLSHGDLAGAANLMEGALRVVLRSADQEILLANLAAERAGDSHALDRGQPLATLCLRALAALHGIDGQRGAEVRRKAWMAAGVIIDDLSAPVLVFNLRATTGSALEQVLDLHRRQGEPVFLTYRLLEPGQPFEPLDPTMRRVFICENPSVVSAAAREIGPRCQPIICTNGQPASAARLLLSKLRQAGGQLYCHADFDWAGLRIVDQLVREYAAISWRMTVEAYLSVDGSVPLDPQPLKTTWAPDLPDALRTRGTAVFEEQVVRSLLEDLRQGQARSALRAWETLGVDVIG